MTGETPRSTVNSSQKSPRKLTQDEVEKLTSRVYTQAVDHRKQQLELLEKKFFPEEPAKVLAKEQIEASVARQVDDEMQRRAKRSEGLQTKHYKDDETKKLSASELEDSVRRIYTDSMRLHQENLLRLEEKHSFKSKSSAIPPLDIEAAKASGARLAVPKKKVFSADEYNKAYGF